MIGADRTLYGFRGVREAPCVAGRGTTTGAIGAKRERLAREGVRFDPDGRVSSACVLAALVAPPGGVSLSKQKDAPEGRPAAKKRKR